MDALESALRARSRRAYELGRLGFAARRALLLVPVLALPILGCSDPSGSLASGGALIILVTLCLWRGEGYGQGVRPGLIAGLVPLLLPSLAQATGHLCLGGRCLLFPAVCVAGGLAGGIALGLLAPSPRSGQGIPFMTACVLAGLAGSVGCLLYGLIGLAGLVAGLVVGVAPVLAARRA